MKYNELLDRSNTLLRSAAEILESPESGGEDRTKADNLVKEAQELRERAETLRDIRAMGRVVAEEDDKKNEDKATPPDNNYHGGFESWGGFLQKVHYACHPKIRIVDSRLVFMKEKDFKEGMQSDEEKVMMEATGAGGGYLVPSEFLPQLQAVQAESALVRPKATIIRMKRRQIQVPVLDQTGTTAGIPHWFGGMQFYWAEEATAKTATDASFRQVTLTAHKLIGYTRASDELIEDSAISLGDFLAGPLGFAGGSVWMEDYAFLNGTGAGQPKGIINAGCTIAVARQATVPAIQYTDLVNMMENFLPSATGSWIFNQTAMSNLMLMMDQAGGGANQGSYIWGSATDGVPSRLLGMPLQFTEKNPAAGTRGDVILADWKYYLLGDRQATTIESTQFDYWRYDQTSWRMVHRVDGQPWLSAPLTLQDGTTQISPFVVLTDKST